MTAPTPMKRSSFFANVLKLVSGTTLAQLITILTAPIISRLYAPEDFGILNVFTSLIAILSIIICLRYEYAIMLPEEDADAANLFVICLVIALGISAIAGVLLIFFGPYLVSFLNAPSLTAFLWLIPIGLLIQGFFAALNYWNSRSKHFGRLSIARISASATTSGAPILLASTGRSGSASLVFSYLAGTFVFAGVLGVQVLKENGAKFIGYVDRSHLIANLKRYKKFPLVDSWGAFINNLSWQLPSLMLLYYFSETVVGYYSLSSRMILLPMTLVGTSIAQVFYQRSAELRSNPESLSRSVELVFRRLAALGLFPAVILAVAGPELFSIVFGEKWLEAGRYAQILSPWMFILFISSPLATLFATLERQELAFGVNVVILISRIAALVVGGMTQNIYMTLIVWSGTGFIIYGGLALWLLRLSHVPWSSSFRSVVQYIAYAILPAFLLIVFTRTLNQYAILLLVLTLAMAIIYYAIVISKDHDMRDTLLAQISSRQIHSG